MKITFHSDAVVAATVVEVRPKTGLAYLAGDDAREWTVTKSTRGCDFEGLREGQRLKLTLEHNNLFTVVRECHALGS